jgi:hypothetical protein
LTILEQFERIFQLLEFKEVYKNHSIKIFVDKIDYTDSKGKAKVLHCKFQDGEFPYQGKPELIGPHAKRLQPMKIIFLGEHNGKTKGLIEIAKELKVKFRPKIKLDDLRKLLSEYPVFKTVRKNYLLDK